MGKLNEKRFELSNPYPVKKNEIIDIVERSTRLVHTATDDKTIQLYIYSKGREKPEAFAEVEITSVGYILHGAEGYDYQGNSLKEFENDLNDVVFHFDAITSKRFGENKEQLFESLLNETQIEPFYEGIFSPKPWSAKGIEKAKKEKEKQIPHKYSVHISDIDVKQLFGLFAMQNIKKDVDPFGFGIAKVAGKFYLYLWHPTEVNWRHPKMGLNELTGEITLNRLSIDFTDEMADDLCHWIKDKEMWGVCSGRVWPIYASPVGSNGLAKYEGIMVFGDDASSVHKYIKLYDKLTNGRNALPIDEGSTFGGDISDIPNKFQTGSWLSVDLDPEEIMSLGIGQRDIRDETTRKPYGEVSLDESKVALFDKLLEE